MAHGIGRRGRRLLVGAVLVASQSLAYAKADNNILFNTRFVDNRQVGIWDLDGDDESVAFGTTSTEPGARLEVESDHLDRLDQLADDLRERREEFREAAEERAEFERELLLELRGLVP